MNPSGRVIGTLPASDLLRAKEFYAQKLGLKPVVEYEGGLVYECAGNSKICLFPSTGRASGDHTQATFEVDDIEAEVASLRSNGVVFEEYDLPDFKTDNGIAVVAGLKGAWFKDSEGNLIALSEPLPY